jgi:hypothetical protein
MGTIHYFDANGAVRCEEGALEAPERAAACEFVGGTIEHVWVLYKEKRTCMLVHENGIALGFPVNSQATEIYREWPRRRGMDVSALHIHGNAIVLEDINLS